MVVYLVTSRKGLKDIRCFPVMVSFRFHFRTHYPQDLPILRFLRNWLLFHYYHMLLIVMIHFRKKQLNVSPQFLFRAQVVHLDTRSRDKQRSKVQILDYYAQVHTRNNSLKLAWSPQLLVDFLSQNVHPAGNRLRTTLALKLRTVLLDLRQALLSHPPCCFGRRGMGKMERFVGDFAYFRGPL